MLWVIVGILICFGFVIVRGAPYVPTHRRQIDAAFDDLYKLSPSDMLIDLGSGDGSVLRAAHRHGARAVGYELNPLLVVVSMILGWRQPGTRVILADYLRVDALPCDASVVYAFTTSHSIEAIGRKMREWSDSRTLYLISYGFTLSDKSPQATIGPMHLYKFINGK